MESCLTKDLKIVLTGMLEAEGVPRETISSVINQIPLCPVGVPRAEAVAEAKKRKVPAMWTDPTTGKIIEPSYVDEKGKVQSFSSISAIVADRGLPMSGIQCDAEGKSCRATSAVQILQIHGYVVSGDGEPEKGVSHKLTVYHPKAPQLKKLA